MNKNQPHRILSFIIPISSGKKMLQLPKFIIHSLDFAVNQFLMKLFKPANVDIVRDILSLNYQIERTRQCM